MPRPTLRLAGAIAAILLVALAGCAPRATPRAAWEPVAIGTDAEFEDLCFADSLNGWMVGGGYSIDGGLIARTSDGGKTWRYRSGLATREPGVFGFNLEAVEFLGSLHGIVAADGGKIFLTEDGGENWRLVRDGRGSTDHVFDLNFLNDRQGWAVGLGGVLATLDGGETWTPISRTGREPNQVSGHAIQFLDARRGWLAGQYGSLMRTEDGGANWTRAWTPLAENERPYLFDLSFPDALHGWVVGEQGTILHTANGGATWSRQETGLEGVKSAPKLERIRRGSKVKVHDLGDKTSGLFLTAVRFVDAEHGWVAGHFSDRGRSVLLRTDDGGATWKVDAEAEGEALRALFLLDRDHGWAVGDRVREGSQVLLRRAPGSAKTGGS